MVWVDNISQLEYYSPNPQWGCYKDPVINPSDILLQARYPTALNPDLTIYYEVNIMTPDGTLLESLPNGGGYFDIFTGKFTRSGIVYYFTNLRCSSYSSRMLSNICFVINFKIYDSADTVYFNKYTQAYTLFNTTVMASSVRISGATDVVTLCGSPAIPTPCDRPVAQFISTFDCIDSFTGDYYANGEGTTAPSIGSTPFSFYKLSNIEARWRDIPINIKRTTSINNRTQRVDAQDKYTLAGTVTFPVWKMREIEGMMRGQHLYVNGTEYKSEGGTPFTQFGRPYNCQYAYKMVIDFVGDYMWQVYGCGETCEAQSLYFLIP